MNFRTSGNGGHVPSSKIMSICWMPSAVKYEGQYSSELRRTTRPMFRWTKCVSTFLKGCDTRAEAISGTHEGRAAYAGDVKGIGATGCDCGEAKARNWGEIQLKSPMSTRSKRSYLA